MSLSFSTMKTANFLPPVRRVARASFGYGRTGKGRRRKRKS